MTEILNVKEWTDGCIHKKMFYLYYTIIIKNDKLVLIKNTSL